LYEIVSSFKFVETKKGQNVFEYGESGELFYIIVKGTVGIMIPNPNIANWKREKREFD
jgi:CRP-like cAMP-binding protein